MSFNFKDFTTVQDQVKISLIDLNWYKDRYQIPATKNGAEQDQMISKWIVNATDQIDSLCNYRLTTEIPTFDPESKQDAKELSIIQSCVGDTVEYFIMNGRLFADLDKNVQGSTPFDVKSKSSDGDLEKKRLDILRKLSSTRFYATFVSTDAGEGGASYQSNVDYSEDSILNPLSEDFQTLVGLLRNHFLTNNNSNKQNGNILFSQNSPNNNDTKNDNRQIIGSSHIKSNAFNQGLSPSNYPSILGYIFTGLVSKSENTDKINFDDGYYSVVELVDKYGLAFFGKALTQALTRQEVYNLIQANNLTWRVDFVYELGVLVFYEYVRDGVKFVGQAISLIANNIGNNPADESAPFVNWDIITSSGVDVTGLVEEVLTQVKPLLPALIETELNKLDTIDYISEYPNQTLSFDKATDFEAYKTASGTTDADYVDIPVTPIPDNLMTTDTPQTVTGVKTFGSVIITDLPTVSSNGANKGYVDSKDTETLTTSKTYTDTTIETAIDTAVLDLVDTKTAQTIDGVKTFNKPVKAPSPIAANDLTNKNYVDEKLDKFMTTDTSQVITGSKEFYGAINIIKPPTISIDATNKKYVDEAIANGGGVWENIPYSLNSSTGSLEFGTTPDDFIKVQIFGGWDDIITGNYINVIPLTWEVHNVSGVNGLSYNSDLSKFFSLSLSSMRANLTFGFFAPIMDKLKIYGIRR